MTISVEDQPGPQAPTLARVLTGLRWIPNRDTLAALASYLLVVAGLYTAFQVFTTERVAANFLTFAPITLGLMGVAAPALYTTLARRRPLEDLGITARSLLPSLGLSLLLGWDTYRHTLATLEITSGRNLVPLIALALTVGLFEAIFFRGWLQLRLEDAFGAVPGLVLAALAYSLYHIGYGMEAGELVFLFFLGITFGAMFRLTKSVFVLWPLYTPVGGLFTNLNEGLSMPFEATYGFVLTLALMLGVLVLASRLGARRSAMVRPTP
jgi:membrane protease YdiL (CAAX protease family)